MSYKFTIEDINKISRILSQNPEDYGDSWHWTMKNSLTKQSLVFTLYNNVNIKKDTKGALLSVQTHQGYYELHDCTGYIVFEPDEIIFYQVSTEAVSSIIIGKQCTCSVYSNISRDILGADFSSLDPAVLLSAMQLSLTENVINL